MLFIPHFMETLSYKKEDLLKTLLKSILAGIMIAIGGVCFLAIENKIVGAFVFSLGLFMVVTRGLNLFTGKVGFWLGSEKGYGKELCIILLGNFLGACGVGALMRLTRFAQVFGEKATALSLAKIGDSPLSIFILAIFCGVLMYLAVDTYRSNPDQLARYLALFLCVGGFILCGFEHCVANMFYFTVAGAWSMKSLVWMFVMVVGNSVGSLAFAYVQKCSQ